MAMHESVAGSAGKAMKCTQETNAAAATRSKTDVILEQGKFQACFFLSAVYCLLLLYTTPS